MYPGAYFEAHIFGSLAFLPLCLVLASLHRGFPAHVYEASNGEVNIAKVLDVARVVVTGAQVCHDNI